MLQYLLTGQSHRQAGVVTNPSRGSKIRCNTTIIGCLCGKRTARRNINIGVIPHSINEIFIVSRDTCRCGVLNMAWLKV